MRRFQHTVRGLGVIYVLMVMLATMFAVAISVDAGRLYQARDYLREVAASASTAGATSVRLDNPRVLDQPDAIGRANSVVTAYANQSRHVRNLTADITTLPTAITVAATGVVDNLIAIRFFVPELVDGGVRLTVEETAFPCFVDDPNAPWAGPGQARSCTRPAGDR